MVNLLARVALAFAVAAGPPGAPRSGADLLVRPALAKGGYPWYDARTDSVVPVWPPGRWFTDWLDGLRLPRLGWLGAGEYLAIGLVTLALAALLAVLVELWRRYQPGAGDDKVAGAASGDRIEGLPAGVSPGFGDPWEEALRCRQRGDYARAVICLFAHQLIALDRIRALRLAPGRTGRQLVRAVDDERLRAPVEQTLRLFEMVYYGRRVPSAEAFEAVWSQAEELERRLAVEVIA